MVIRAMVDQIDREIQQHQAATRRLTEFKRRLIKDAQLLALQKRSGKVKAK